MRRHQHHGGVPHDAGQRLAVLAGQEVHLPAQPEVADEGVQLGLVVREVRRGLADHRQIRADGIGQAGHGADGDVGGLEGLQPRGEHDVAGADPGWCPGMGGGMEQVDVDAGAHDPHPLRIGPATADDHGRLVPGDAQHQIGLLRAHHLAVDPGR